MTKPKILSTAYLLGANLVALWFALQLNWSLIEVLIVYWLQAAMVGESHRRKMRDILDFAAHSSERRRQQIGPLMQAGIQNGFAGIYGLVWIALGVALAFAYVKAGSPVLRVWSLLLVVALFAVIHWWSYRVNKPFDQRRRIDVNLLMLPLFRILIPLHIFLVVVGVDAVSSATSLTIWMLIKSAADVGGHVVEHRVDTFQ
ncbi:MAG: DUF6498-containing protein [Pseudomonadota bacterium]